MHLLGVPWIRTYAACTLLSKKARLVNLAFVIYYPARDWLLYLCGERIYCKRVLVAMANRGYGQNLPNLTTPRTPHITGNSQSSSPPYSGCPPCCWAAGRHQALRSAVCCQGGQPPPYSLPLPPSCSRTPCGCPCLGKWKAWARLAGLTFFSPLTFFWPSGT